MNVWIACHKETGEPEWRFPVARTKSTAENYIIGGYMTETHEPVEYVPADKPKEPVDANK